MAISNHASEAEQAAETERVWQEFWIRIIARPDGSIDMDQVKRELHDAHMVFDHCRRAYGWMTRDRVTNVTTLPEVAIEIAEEIRNEEIDEAVKELQDLVDEMMADVHDNRAQADVP